MRLVMKNLIILLAIFFLSIRICSGQENFASNISKNVSDDEKFLITYDIISDNGAKSFSVILLITYQGKQIKATAAYGDLGSNISPGEEKAIVWYYKTDFDGNIEDVNVDVYAYKENEPQAIFEIVSLGNGSYAPCEVVFLNNSSYANEYQWNFGDPSSGALNIAFEKNPKHLFKKGGFYSIALTARNTQLNLESVYYQSIEIKTHDPTISNFEIEGNNQLAPALVSFKNISVNADTYKWNFGDTSGGRKNNSDEKNPKYKYKNPGSYSVELIVKNNFSGLSDTLVQEVIIEQVKVAGANFVLTKSTETAPSTVVFKNTSANSIKYEWNFGDPSSGEKNISEEVDPVHIYNKPGNYKVELSSWAKGEKKPNTITKELVISELPKPPEAHFSIENNNVLGPATIIFNNSSINAEGYHWDFGDPDSGNENTSDKPNPTHTYKKAGRYKVTLTVSRSEFKNESTTTDYVVIVESSKPPVANFRFNAKDFMVPAEINFSNASVNADSYIWDFGEDESANNASFEVSPSHTYLKAGRYKVVLTAKNKQTGGESIFSDFVIVNEKSDNIVAPIAKFSIENNNMPSPAILKFTDQSTDAHSYSWNFGDESSTENTSVLKNPVHIYSEAGRYMVTLTAKNENSGEEDMFTDFVVVKSPAKPAIRPVAKFTAEPQQGDAPAKIFFSNKSEEADLYEWDFGDTGSENNISSLENPTHTYSKAGRYRVELMVTNSSSNLKNTYSDFITISQPPIEPLAIFDILDSNTVAPAVVKFINNSKNANSFAWDFGDILSGSQNTSTLQNPEHLFQNPGEYIVELSALNKESGIENVIKKVIAIEKKMEPPIADFEITFNGEYVPIDVDFKNLSTNANTYKWNFGDFDSENNESTLEAPSHLYNISGKYKITLEAFNSTGEKNEITKEITLKSNYSTFVTSTEFGESGVCTFSVIESNKNNFIVLIQNDKNNSSVVSVDYEGNITKETKLDYLATDIIKNENEYTIVGIDDSKKLLIQNTSLNFKKETPVYFLENKNFKTDFAQPKLRMSLIDEIGVLANIIDDKYPIDIYFQKTDKSGRIIPLIDRTFKYVGVKLVTDMISTKDGGFALTGYYQDEIKSPLLILFGKIDRNGHGVMHLIGSEMNILGFDIEESHEDGYAILRAKEGTENDNIYEISLAIVDSDGGPTDCSTMLPCSIQKKDILLYNPKMIKNKDGYVIASHGYNGFDYDISLFWTDKTGSNLLRYEAIKLPGDQFVMDLLNTSEGGYLISGTQLTEGNRSALLIKTDPYGKLNTFLH
jgi:PKD repeat protein